MSGKKKQNRSIHDMSEDEGNSKSKKKTKRNIECKDEQDISIHEGSSIKKRKKTSALDTIATESDNKSSTKKKLQFSTDTRESETNVTPTKNKSQTKRKVKFDVAGDGQMIESESPKKKKKSIDSKMNERESRTSEFRPHGIVDDDKVESEPRNIEMSRESDVDHVSETENSNNDSDDGRKNNDSSESDDEYEADVIVSNLR